MSAPRKIWTQDLCRFETEQPPAEWGPHTVYHHDDVVRELVAVLARVSRYLPSDTVRCRGDKCREPWCISCCGEDAAEAYMEVVRADAAALAKIAQEDQP